MGRKGFGACGRRALKHLNRRRGIWMLDVLSFESGLDRVP